MNLTIQREALLEPLQLVTGVVEKRHTVPILANVLLTVEEHALSITATDLEIELIGRIRLDEPVKEHMQLTVPGRKFLDICRTLPDKASIDLQLDKERLIVRSGRSRFILSTLPVESFPNFKESQVNAEFVMTQKELSTLLQRTHFSMAQQDVRYYLNGMLLDIKTGKMVAVATDGHRFSMNSSLATTDMLTTQVIIPRKGVLELMRLLKGDDAQEVVAALGDDHVCVRNQSFTFTSKLIDGRFPDYERVMPKGKEQFVLLDRDVFREALQRVAILSNEQFRAVRIQLHENLLRIVASNPEHEEAEEIIQLEHSGSELDITFNVSYLLDILNTVSSGNIKLIFTDSNSRIFIQEEHNEQSLFLVMPLQP